MSVLQDRPLRDPVGGTQRMSAEESEACLKSILAEFATCLLINLPASFLAELAIPLHPPVGHARRVWAWSALKTLPTLPIPQQI